MAPDNRALGPLGTDQARRILRRHKLRPRRAHFQREDAAAMTAAMHKEATKSSRCRTLISASRIPPICAHLLTLSRVAG